MSKILVAVHGFEPRGWVERLVCTLALPGEPVVWVLVALDVPSPSCSSLLPAARWRYAAARAEWRRLAEARTQPALAALIGALPTPPEVERVVGNAPFAVVATPSAPPAAPGRVRFRRLGCWWPATTGEA